MTEVQAKQGDIDVVRGQAISPWRQKGRTGTEASMNSKPSSVNCNLFTPKSDQKSRFLVGVKSENVWTCR